MDKTFYVTHVLTFKQNVSVSPIDFRKINMNPGFHYFFFSVISMVHLNMYF